MKKKSLLMSVLALVFGFSVAYAEQTPQDWFDAGVRSGFPSASGMKKNSFWSGACASSTSWNSDKSCIDLDTTATQTLSYAVADADKVVLASYMATVKSTLKFTLTPSDTLTNEQGVVTLPIPEGSKGGLTVVTNYDDEAAAEWWGLTKVASSQVSSNTWTKLVAKDNTAPDVSEATNITINIKVETDGKPYVQYLVGTTPLLATNDNADANGWIEITTAPSATSAAVVTNVCFSGLGEIYSLTGTKTQMFPLGGEGTEAQPFQIPASKDGLDSFLSAFKDYSAKIDAVRTQNGSVWFKIATADTSFVYNGENGFIFPGTFVDHFDGNGCTITFAAGKSSDNSTTAFFEALGAGSEVKNVTFNCTGLSTGATKSAIVCGSTTGNVVFEDVTATATPTAPATALATTCNFGGFVCAVNGTDATADSLAFTNCQFNAKVAATLTANASIAGFVADGAAATMTFANDEGSAFIPEGASIAVSKTGEITDTVAGMTIGGGAITIDCADCISLITFSGASDPYSIAKGNGSTSVTKLQYKEESGEYLYTGVIVTNLVKATDCGASDGFVYAYYSDPADPEGDGDGLYYGITKYATMTYYDKDQGIVIPLLAVPTGTAAQFALTDKAEGFGYQFNYAALGTAPTITLSCEGLVDATSDDTENKILTKTLASGQAYSGGSGTAEDPWKIATQADLEEFRTEVEAGSEKADDYYEQTANIVITYDSDTAYWDGIGTGARDFTKPFKGVYDGKGHSITGLRFCGSEKKTYQGLFDCTQGATIKNLKVATTGDGFTSGTRNYEYGAALVAGAAQNTDFEYVETSGNLVSAHNQGGLVVRYYGTGTFLGCTNKVNITCNNPAEFGHIGGMCGMAQKTSDAADKITFTNCCNEGDLIDNSTHSESGTDLKNGVGAMIGLTSTHITFANCVNTGALSSTAANRTGLFYGYYNHGDTVSKTVDILGVNKTVAGVPSISHVYGSCTCNGNYKFATIADGVATLVAPATSVSATAEYAAMSSDADTAFTITAADASLTILTNCMPYAGTVTVNVSGYRTTPSVSGDATKVVYTPAPFFPQPQSDFTAEEITKGYHLRTGESADSAFVIRKYADLVTLKEMVDGGTSTAGVYFEQVSDIDMSATAASGWTGIGTSKTVAFNGVYDGNGKTVTALSFATATDYNGLFRYANGAAISNLTVDVTGIVGTPSGKTGAAAFVGKGYNVTLRNLLATGKIGTSAARLTHNAAGIAVAIYGGAADKTATLYACTNRAAIYNAYTKAGGIVAMINSSDDSGLVTLEKCSNEGPIDNQTTSDNNNYTGGLVGWDGYGGPAAYRDCRNTASVVSSGTFTDHAGSLFGQRQASGTGAGVFGTISTIDGMQTTACGGENDTLLRYATVADGIATFVAADDFALGGTYKLMKTALTPAYTFTEAGTIAFNTNLYAAASFSVAASPTAKFTVTPSEDAGVVTYTATVNMFSVSTTGGSNATVVRSPADESVAYGTTVTITATPDSGYSYADVSLGTGWGLNTSGAATNSVTVVENTVVAVPDAVSSETTYTCTFDVKAAESGAAAISDYKWQASKLTEDYTLPTPTPTVEGKTFSAWYDAAGTAWTKIPAGYAQNIALTAKWLTTTKVVIGTGSEEVNVKLTKEYTNPNDTASNGNKVWVNDVIGITNQTTTATLVSTQDVTVANKIVIKPNFVPTPNSGATVKYVVIDTNETVQAETTGGTFELPVKTGVYTVSVTVKVGDSTAAETVTISQKVGVQTVTKLSNAGTDGRSKTPVAVQWTNIGSAESINADDVIMRAKLNEGDKLYIYQPSSSAYRTYTLDANKAWSGATTYKVDDNNPTVITPVNATEVAIPRGSAIWVETAADIVTYGGYTTSGAYTSLEAGANLVGSPATEALDINTKFSDASSNDVITVLSSTVPYVYTKGKDGKWGAQKWTGRRWSRSTENATVPAGQGFWYKSEKAGSINW